MADLCNELALRRAVRAGHPSALDRVTAGSGEAGPLADVCALSGAAADAARTRLEQLERELAPRVTGGDPVALERVAAATDRAAAALERYEAAVERHLAADHRLRTSKDALTGALARDAGMECLQREVDRSRREGLPLVLAFLDVDGLKAVNDKQGHLAGDQVLRAVGTALQCHLRAYDVSMRFGGDEFVCALSATTLRAGRRRMLQVQRVLSGLHPGCSVSVGLAQLRKGESLLGVLDRADRALYAGRRALRAEGREPAVVPSALEGAARSGAEPRRGSAVGQ